MASNASDLLDTPAALGLLINLSGKMRMLSHRIAMFILLRTLDSADRKSGDDTSRQSLNNALQEFERIYQALCQGSKDMRIAPEVAELLRSRGAMDDESRRIIAEFLAQAGRFARGNAGTDSMAFVQFVAGPLLERLNHITEGVSRTLDHLHEEQRISARKSETTVIQTLAAIEKVSLSVRLIAINAATEAVRAGDAGRGFAVIAKEIRSLSDRTTELVSSVRTHLH